MGRTRCGCSRSDPAWPPMNTRPANIAGATTDGDRGELRTVDRMSVKFAEVSTRIDQPERRADEANHRADTADARADAMDRQRRCYHRCDRRRSIGHWHLRERRSKVR